MARSELLFKKVGQLAPRILQVWWLSFLCREVKKSKDRFFPTVIHCCSYRREPHTPQTQKELQLTSNAIVS
jgi:hypothetical protein